uniref:Uncharacterized protein n=1 Tax=Neogobius melanostomus TaxID=47308 RepID=A0A8C6SGN1_9GOBI
MHTQYGIHVKEASYLAEIPSWLYMLKNLRELYLIGNLNSENNKLIGLESLRDLRHLKVLHLKSNLTKIPTNITDLLKKMMNLAELELHNCELERIPHAIFSLTNLQELDLKSNNIRTIEEIISFQHLKRLTCLKLWHNKIIAIPISISHVKTWNRFTCPTTSSYRSQLLCSPSSNSATSTSAITQ